MPGTGFSGVFTTSFYRGGASLALVPHKFDVAIGGRGYMLNRDYLQQTPLISTIRATRAQSDASQEPGEQSLTPDDLWRRTQQSWHLGAGQDYLDREDSERDRFRTSKGINPWTKGEVSLLNATVEKLNSANTNLALMPAGSRLYVTDGAVLKFTTDLTAYTTVTGTTAVATTSIASDGYFVWVTDGADIYRTNTGITTAASWSLTDADLLGYVKGRLLYAKGATLGYFSDMTVPTSTALFTHATSTFTWVGFAEGPGHIYAAGYAGDKSLVYRIGITREGVALDAPTVAGELPDGERIYAIGSYLGFIFLGTSVGVRFCTLDGQGNLTIGDLIRTVTPVRCFEGQGAYVWFGWTNYDSTSTGLGRLSLRYLAEPDALLPAYATDLMVTAQANILSVCTFLDLRVFAVSGDGIYAENTAAKVSTGQIDSGRLGFGITDPKIPLYLDATYASGFVGSATAYVAVDGSSTFTLVGTHTSTETANTFPTGQVSVDQIEVRWVLVPSGATSPILLRHTVRAQPVPAMRQRIVLPLLLANKVRSRAGIVTYDVQFEIGVFEGWRFTKQIVAVQVGDEIYSASLDDFDFVADAPVKDRSFWQGTCIDTFKTV